MAFAAPLFATLGAAGGAATTTAAATSLAKLGTIVQAVGAGVGGIATLASANYNAKVAENNAAVEDMNAERAIERAAIIAQEQDVEARGELGALISRAGASGLDARSGSLAGSRRSLQQLAAKDRGLTTHEGQVGADNARQRASDYRSQASLSKSRGTFGFLGSTLEVGSSLITGASRINRIRAKSIGQGI